MGNITNKKVRPIKQDAPKNAPRFAATQIQLFRNRVK